MDNKATFAQRFTELCSGMTQKEVADIFNVTRASIGYYQNNERSPDINMLAKIAQHFGVTADYLVGLSDAKQPENTDIVERLGLTERSIRILSMYKMQDGLDFEDGSLHPYSTLDIINRFLYAASETGLFLQISAVCDSMERSVNNPSFKAQIDDIVIESVNQAKAEGREFEIDDVRDFLDLAEKIQNYDCRVISAGEEIEYRLYQVNQILGLTLSDTIKPIQEQYIHHVEQRAKELQDTAGEPDGDD